MDNPETHQEILSAFHKSLSQESHILTKCPRLFWQQIYNRLYWTSLAPESHLDLEEIELQKPRIPWIRSKIPPKESSNLIKIIEGHTNSVNGCAFGRSSDQALSVSSDGTIRIWDLRTSSTIVVFEFFDTLFCCDWSENGEYFAAGSRGENLFR